MIRKKCVMACLVCIEIYSLFLAQYSDSGTLRMDILLSSLVLAKFLLYTVTVKHHNPDLGTLGTANLGNFEDIAGNLLVPELIAIFFISPTCTFYRV